MSEETYLLIKRGLYWRPNSMGYTGLKDEAGRYSKDEAVQRVNYAVQMIEESIAPLFSPSCYDDTKLVYLFDTLSKKEGELESERAKVKGLSEIIYSQKQTHDALVKRCRELEEERNMFAEKCDEFEGAACAWIKRIAKLEAQNKRMMDALEFYSDEDNLWYNEVEVFERCGELTVSFGTIAKQALSEES